MENKFTALKFELYFGLPLSPGEPHVFLHPCICSADAATSFVPISKVCCPLQRRLSQSFIFLSRPILLHGFCPTDLSRKFTRYRNLPQRDADTITSHGLSRSSCSKHSGVCKREPRLAYFCRLRADIDSPCSK